MEICLGTDSEKYVMEIGTMTDEQFVRSIYPDAAQVEFTWSVEHPIAICSGSVLDKTTLPELLGLGKTSPEAWADAKRNINLNMLEKFGQ